MPRYLPHIVIVGLGLLLASLNIIYKRHDFWGRLLYCILTAAVILGLAMTAVFDKRAALRNLPIPIFQSGQLPSKYRPQPLKIALNRPKIQDFWSSKVQTVRQKSSRFSRHLCAKKAIFGAYNQEKCPFGQSFGTHNSANPY